jgi:hypothetical protein
MPVIRLALLLSLVGSAARADQATVDLSGTVKGASGPHAVYVALWCGEGFLEPRASRTHRWWPVCLIRETPALACRGSVQPWKLAKLLKSRSPARSREPGGPTA